MKKATAATASVWNPFAPTRGAGENDATIAAVVFTLLLHMLLYYAVPQTVAYAETASSDPQRSLDFLLVDPEEKRDERFVMAAPDREQQRPEDTINISDRDQVAAQEEVAPLSPDNTPLVDGDEENSNRIIQGNPFQQPSPQPSFGGGEQSDSADSPMQERRAAPRDTGSAAEIEAPEAETVEPDGEGAIVVEQRGDSPREADIEVPDSVAESAAQERSPLDGDGRDRLETPPQQASESPVPRPRQTVERPTSYGPLRSSHTGAIRIGRLALDAQYSEFGEYWTRVAEIIERRWRNILYNSRSVAFRGARVTVKFDITREGEVENVEILFSDAGRLAETISTDAITSEAPYFRWTPEMILRMGDRSSFRVTFIY